MSFEKGQSGNPGGRPKVRLADGRTLSDLAKEHTAQAVHVLTEVMTNGASETARVSAATAILDRGWGRPPQTFPDTYPHYVRPDLRFKDGRSVAVIRGPIDWDGLKGELGRVVGTTQLLWISRRSNRKSDDDVETPLEKLLKVIKWLNTQ